MILLPFFFAVSAICSVSFVNPVCVVIIAQSFSVIKDACINWIWKSVPYWHGIGDLRNLWYASYATTLEPPTPKKDNREAFKTILTAFSNISFFNKELVFWRDWILESKTFWAIFW